MTAIRQIVSRREAREAAEACIRVLKEQFGVRKVYLFGSAAGQSPWHSRSDIDLAVEGLSPSLYIKALSALYEKLPDGIELDLITLEDAPPELAARIRGEAELPRDPTLALQKAISGELVNLERIVDQAAVLMAHILAQPTSVEIMAGGKLAHDFYSGVERIFKRIAIRLGPGLPPDDSWHAPLLRSMESKVEGVRAPVIDDELALELWDYLRFREGFRHTISYELQWSRLRALIEGLPDILHAFNRQIEKFLQSLNDPAESSR